MFHHYFHNRNHEAYFLILLALGIIGGITTIIYGIYHMIDRKLSPTEMTVCRNILEYQLVLLDLYVVSFWWTLFIIVPCLVSVAKNGFNPLPTAGLIIGLLWLLSAWNLFPSYLIWRLFFIIPNANKIAKPIAKYFILF